MKKSNLKVKQQYTGIKNLFIWFSILLFTACTEQGKLTNSQNPTSQSDLFVDFRYQPGWWRSNLCFPDDSVKSMVEQYGELMYHYPGRFYSFGGKNLGFQTTIGVEVSEKTKWISQQFLSPRIPVMQTVWEGNGLEVVQEAFASFKGNQPDKTNRYDIILVKVKNTTHTPKTVSPKIRIKSELPLTFSKEHQQVQINATDNLVSTIGMEKERELLPQKRSIHLEALTIQAGEEVSFAVSYGASGIPSLVLPATIEEIEADRNRIVQYWESIALPYGKINVPDPQIQELIESSIRNIWQAREIKNELPAFQVGPAKYRGLWIVDGAFLLETATMLGAGQEARNGVQYILNMQKEDGSYEEIAEHYKENGIVLWTCVRQAKLMNDKEWLRGIWPQLEKTVSFIKELRQRTYRHPEWLCQGLIPPGMIDGGLASTEKANGEYTNVYWNLMGLKAIIEGAEWLGEKEQAEEWQKEYDTFHAVFKKAAERDLRADANGNMYLPTVMGNINNHTPQRAQWAFCQAVHPGQIFEKDDPIVSGTLAMLEDTEEEGMVIGTGWLPEGIWNYFASFYAHAHLWQGNGRKASELLYAMGNHASPTLIWCEEHHPKDYTFKPFLDMPHNWASAEFVRLAVHLLAFERG
ncbi:MAG TPA: hypothetical protein PKA53_06680, partial [Sphingobacterium sp.]|nr:hypothetical protein [Sphingobacterium sp.]